MLHDLQRNFTNAVFGLPDSGFGGEIADGRFPAERLLQIYRNNVFAGLTGALRAVYPVVERLVGEGFFRYAADGYIRRHPSRGGNLHDFGNEFAGFLADFAPAAGHPYLADVARLEWAWHRAFHGAEHVPLDPSALAVVPAEHHGDIRFTLHPAAHLLASDYPLLRLWQINQPDQPDDQTADLAGGGDNLLICRPRDTVEIRTLDRGEFTLLQALARDETLSEACDRAVQSDPAFDLAASLQRHIRDNTLVAFRAPTGDTPH